MVEIVYEDMRCTMLTLKAFGVVPEREAKTGIDVLHAFYRAGFNWNPVVEKAEYIHKRPLSEVLPMLKVWGGDYYVVTSGHAMAFRDGKLWDAAMGTMRRRVIGVYRIEKKVLDK